MNNLTNEETTSAWMPWLNFFTEHAGLLVALSLLSAVLTLALVPVLIIRIPADYFSHHRRLHISKRHPLLNIVIKVAKNFLGAVFLLVGFVLLFLPGQGLLLILVGLLIMNYPGKYALERWLIQRPRVLPALNTLRVRRGKPPLLPPLNLSRLNRA